MPYESPEEMMKEFMHEMTAKINVQEDAYSNRSKEIMEAAKVQRMKIIEAMAAKVKQEKAAKKYSVNDTRRAVINTGTTFNNVSIKEAIIQFKATHSSFDPIQPTDQTPRQWNLITIKRCTVSREEFHYYGGLQAVLAKKGFPVVSPENGDLMISWFDPQEGVAYYELCRVQDKGELMKYMQEKFVQEVTEDGGRAISLE